MGDLVPRQQWEQHAADLVTQYAGWVDARDLSPEEQLVAIAAIVPLALQIVEEARDTIERLNDRVEALEGQQEIEDAEVEE